MPAEDKNFFVRDNTGVIAGSLDGVAAEATDKAQLVGLGLKLASDPQGAWDSLVSFKNSLDWSKAGSIAKVMAQGIVGYDATEFDQGGIHTRHATGKVAGTVTFDIITGGIVLSMVNKVPDLLALLSKVTQKLELANWAKADIDAFTWDFQKLEDLLNKFDDGTLDPQAWKALIDLPNFRKDIKVLEQVTALMKNQKAIALFGDAAQLLTSLNKLGKTFDTQTWPNKLNFEDALTQLNKSINSFQGVTGFDESLKKAINNSNAYVQDGLWFSLKDMDGLSASSIKGVDLSFEIDELGNSLPCTSANGKCFDVELVGLTPRFIEYKSVQYFKLSGGKLSFNVGQLKAYLENVSNLSELNYVFNKSKIADPKKFMKTIFEENAEEIWNSGQVKGLFNGLKLKNGADVEDSETFLNYLKEIDSANSLFNFVK